LVISNIASSAKIVGFSLFNFNFSFDGGTLLFPLTYILGDILTEVYGFKTARRAILIGFFSLLLSSLVFLILKILPPDIIWETNIGITTYNSILSGMFTGGIVIASISAYLSGELINAFLLSKIKKITKGKFFWFRSMASSIIGQFIDTIIFIFIATLLHVFPKEIFWNLIITNYIFKMLLEIIILPLTYKIVFFLKKKENQDI
jgi:uncharacterized integral membrane protein (TIGR00697 family)